MGLRTSLLLLIPPCLCSIFFLSIRWMMKFSSKISLKLCKLEYSYLVCRLIMMYCIMGSRTSHSCLFFPVFIYFSFSLHFSSKISPQLYRIETSNLVYRFTMTSCIMELKMGLLLFVLPYICSFFFLSRFFVKGIFTTVSDRNFKFGIQVHNIKLYSGIENGPSPICSFLYLFCFLLLQIFRQRYLYNRLR